jgi:hypothetical protein
MRNNATVYSDQGASFSNPEIHESINDLDLSTWSTSELADSIRNIFRNFHCETSEPAGFMDLLHISNDSVANLSANIGQLITHHNANGRQVKSVNTIDLQIPDTDHFALFSGVDYYYEGVVPIADQHMKLLFSNFQPPDHLTRIKADEIAKNSVGINALDMAYCAAIVKAQQAKTILIIGEDRGEFTNFIASQTENDCLILTTALPRSCWYQSGIIPPNSMSIKKINYSDSEIGSVWRNSNEEYIKRIIPLIGDSRHSKLKPWINALSCNIDMVIINGIQEVNRITSELIQASDLLKDEGIILLNNFGQNAPVSAATIAALTVHMDEQNNLECLYQLKWWLSQNPEENIDTNVALLCRRSSV